MPGDVVRAGRQPESLALALGGADGGVEGGGVVGAVVGGDAERGGGDESGGHGVGGGSGLGLDEVEGVGGGGVRRVLLEREHGARREGARQPDVDLVEEVVPGALRGVVVVGVTAVHPGVLVGQGDVAEVGSGGVQAQGRLVGGARGAVRDRVAQGEGVGRLRQGELDVLAGLVEDDGLAARGLRCGLQVGVVGSEDGAVGAAALRLVGRVRDGGAAGGVRGGRGDVQAVELEVAVVARFPAQGEVVEAYAQGCVGRQGLPGAGGGGQREPHGR